MANGKPGDHPLTDIVHYGATVFGSGIDAMVRELAATPGFDGVEDRVAALLWDHWPVWRNVIPDLKVVRSGLEAIRREMVGRAEPRVESDRGGTAASPDS